ncbi:probable choline kinase 2 [Lolium rigidum]|uniref:probable choline kinase 2 n=1 Tax=Lolium rigidum TaxID=89674 RepID=UPI001F5CDA0A|nr:probable choline kinase 2 [Lolium rigidum]
MVAIEGQSPGEAEAAARGVPKEARRLLHELAAEWADVADFRALEVVPLKGAMTNEVYQVRWLTGSGGAGEGEYRKVLMRVYGEGLELFFDREDEVRTFECMSRHGQGPRLLGRFPTGRLEEFIHARTLSAVDLRDPEISASIASKLKEFHNLDMPGPKSFLLWDRLRNWLKTAKSVCPSDEAKEFRLDSLEKEITALESEFSGEDQCIGFCHNDLQYGNIMIDEETKALTIIDYEYSSFNPVAYDIANHFCEMAADYHSEEPHLLDYTKYPDFDERKRFVQTYLISSDGEEPDAEKVKDLLNSIEKYALASHLFWGLWGIISEHVNDIDFDYMDYARQRFVQYWLKKPVILACHADE